MSTSKYVFFCLIYWPPSYLTTHWNKHIQLNNHIFIWDILDLFIIWLWKLQLTEKICLVLTKESLKNLPDWSHFPDQTRLMPLSSFSASSKNIHIWFSATRAGFCLWKSLLYELSLLAISFFFRRHYTHVLSCPFVFSSCNILKKTPPFHQVLIWCCPSFDIQHAT